VRKIATYAVYHMIHIHTPYKYIPKLLIRDVPDSEKVTTDLLERAGYQFGEFNISWANHGLVKVDVKESPADLIARIRQGEGERITWSDLVAKAESPL
jgi:hypothetical protein